TRRTTGVEHDRRAESEVFHRVVTQSEFDRNFFGRGVIQLTEVDRLWPNVIQEPSLHWLSTARIKNQFRRRCVVLERRALEETYVVVEPGVLTNPKVKVLDLEGTSVDECRGDGL